MEPTLVFGNTNLTWLKQGTIFLTRHGSHAYGLNIPSSDEDFKGVAVPPKEYFHGFINIFEQAEWKEPDAVVYDIRKFMRLAADCNPNIIEVLWTSPEDHIITTPLGNKLIAARKLFLSKKAKHTFSGYAVSQLKRIKGHRKWLMNPPEAPPTRAEFGLPDHTVTPKDQLLAAKASIQKQLDATGQVIGFTDNFLQLLDLENKYHNKQKEWEQYQSWKTNRNPVRAAMEAKTGFDGKHAMHLVRLLKMCREILETGEVVVKRKHDREELLAIRSGLRSYEDIVSWAEQQDSELNEVAKKSDLPNSPDRIALDLLCQEIVEEGMRLHG